MSDIQPVPQAPLTIDQKRAQSQAALRAKYNPQAVTPGTAAAVNGPAAIAAKNAAMPDTSLVGNAPPWLQSQKVAPWQGGPQVSLTNVDYSGLPQIPTDFAGADQTAADAAYKGATQFFDEDFGRDRAGLETKLLNQGFQPGTEAYNNEMSRMQRGQDAMRMQAGFQAQGIGHQQAGDLLMRALQARGSMLGERTDMANRLFDQSLGVANLGLGARGQDKGVESTRTAASASAGASHYATDAATRGRELDAELALRNLGLSQDAQNFNQSMALSTMARGGVNMPNFGAPLPLDVGNAYGISSANNNAALNRAGMDRNALYQLGGSLLGSYFGG